MIGRQHQRSGSTVLPTTPKAARPAPRARRYAAAAGGLVAAAALIASLAGSGAASAVSRPTGGPDATTRPTVYEQTAYNQSLAIATGNVHTTVATSPVLAEGNYLVNSVISFNNLTAGSQVLCGWTTTASGDDLYANYGNAENQDTNPTIGSCTVTGTATINNPSDQLILWATVYSGPAGPSASSWSMNEWRAGKVVVSHLS
jgi:hypothetical protein